MHHRCSMSGTWVILIHGSDHITHHRISVQVLRAMLESGMAETSAKEIIIRDVPFSGFNALLQFIYSGSADISPGIAHDVFAVANQVPSASSIPFPILIWR